MNTQANAITKTGWYLGIELFTNGPVTKISFSQTRINTVFVFTYLGYPRS